MSVKHTLFTVLLFALTFILALISGKRSVRRRMTRGVISVGAAGLIAFALLGGLTLGIVVGDKVGRVRGREQARAEFKALVRENIDLNQRLVAAELMIASTARAKARPRPSEQD